MDAYFYRKIEQIAELVQQSEELLRKADDVMDRARLESDALATLVWKSKQHCESADRLFAALGKTTPAGDDFGPDAG